MSATYITSKIDNDRYCKSNGHFKRHLNTNNLTYQEYYEKYITGKSPKCSCGESLTFYQKDESYANSCGDPKCVGKTISEVKLNWTDAQRCKDSNNKKIAAKNRTPKQIQEQTRKTKETFRKKYGTEWITQSDHFKDKAKDTKLERYGNEYYANWDKSSAKNRSKTIEQQDKINNKRRKTNIDKFGVDNPFLMTDVSKKSAKGNTSITEYNLPSGKLVGIRGYENIVLDKLFKSYIEGDVLIHDNYSNYIIPIFEYSSYEHGRRLKYYPDIYIPSENKIIEVKSMWWWNANNREGYAGRIINNMSKRQAVLDAGIEFELWLFTDKRHHEILKTEQDFKKWVI